MTIFKRTPAVPIQKLPGTLPCADINDDVDHAVVADSTIKSLNSLRASHLADESIWRDLYTLTGTLRTMYGPETIVGAWTELSDHHRPRNFTLVQGSSRIARYGPAVSWIQAMFSFEIGGRPQSLCSGIIGIVPDLDGNWKTWLLCTILEQIDGFGDPDVLEPCTAGSMFANGLNKDSIPNYAASLEPRMIDHGEKQNKDPYFDCVVIGAGMAGLCVAGRLKALGVSCTTIDRNDHVGDNWALRYASVKLHTTRDSAEMPFARIWSQEDPYYLPGSVLAKGYRRFAEKYGIETWTSTNVETASWNEAERTWTVKACRAGKVVEIRTRHLVLALGGGGQIPKVPHYPDQELYRGTVLHSKDYTTSAHWAGKHGVIVGTANTAHDVAEDMLGASLSSVTMVQRGRTLVVPATILAHIQDPLYNTHIPTEHADRLSESVPMSVMRQLSFGLLRSLVDAEAEKFDALERAGFKLDRYGDIYHCLYERFGSHYIDIGASEKIGNGQIKMKSDAYPTHYTATGLAFSDGSTLDADVIVFCTGFEGNMRTAATQIVGEEIGDKLEDWWQVDTEGELRGAWKPIGHPGIWYTGGTIGQARYYSRFLAMQIKADLEGLAMVPYTTTHG